MNNNIGYLLADLWKVLLRPPKEKILTFLIKNLLNVISQSIVGQLNMHPRLGRSQKKFSHHGRDFHT